MCAHVRMYLLIVHKKEKYIYSEMDIDKNKRIGLTDEQVKQSREQHGKNVLTPPQRTSLWKLYLDKYRDPIIQILLVAAFVSLILAFIEKNFMETIGIFVAVFLATTVGFYFERDAAKKFNLLTALSEEQPVKVRRNGKVMEIPCHDVVVGDVVLVEVGDEVPADGELIVCNDLQINESALTGEPVAEKSLEGGGDGAYPRNVILRSTMVMNGRGEFVVTAVGDATEIGKVAKKSTEQTSVETPLHMQLDKLAKMISKVGSVVSVAAFFIFLIHDILTNPAWGGKDYFYMAEIVLKYFMMAVTLIVMAVPEGLPMAITLSLALNMRRMLKSNNLVRKLHACETMGAVTVICTDKTGTLTQNKMQVSALELKQGDEALLDTAIALNSTAELNDGKPIGNPTESALLLWLDAQGKDYEELRKQVNVLKQLPFSTERKMMATLAEVDGETYLFVKGAPEIVMKKCIIEDRMLRQSAEELDEWQHKAMRTLAFAYKKIEASIMRTSRTSTAEVVALLDANDLQLQAIAAIADPIRPDVPAAVQECRHAGIEVKVVTGDTAATALEIGKQIGVFEDEPENIGADGSLTSLDQQMITGEQWEALSDEEAYERAKDIRVMSRARPTDKQRLVAMLQKRGEVVAVTGDGTNDAPALHYAHVGLSLGSGTSVAKEASDMTLLDDSFKSIANAVMWGRSLYRNLQRFLFFQLVVNVAALLLVLGGSVIGTEMPLTVTQILWVNIIMDTFAALALASLPPSHEVMKDKPRKASDFIINKSIGFGILFCGIVFFLVMFALLVYCERRGRLDARRGEGGRRVDLPRSADGPRRGHAPGYRDAASVRGRHHGPDEGQHPEPHRICGRVRDGIAHHP